MLITTSTASQASSASVGGKPGMNRTMLVVIILVIILVGVVATVTAFLFLGPVLSVSKQNFAPYSTPVSESSSNPSSLTVTDTNGAVTVSPWSQSNLMINGTVTARGFGTSPSAITFVESNSSGDIIFKAVFPSTIIFFVSTSYTVDINVYIPSSSQFNTVQVFTVNGNIKLSDVNASSIALTDTNGSVSASGLTASSLTMTDTNGNLDFTCTSCGSATATTTNGGVTSNLASLSLTGSYVMTTTNGNIDLKLPPTASFKITTNTTNGSVSSTGLSVQLANHATTTFGTGSAIVNLTTTNGSITVSG